MRILWNGKGPHHDTWVDQLWFDRSKVFYVAAGTRHVSEARTKDIERVVSDDFYKEHRAFERVGQVWPEMQEHN